MTRFPSAPLAAGLAALALPTAATAHPEAAHPTTTTTTTTTPATTTAASTAKTTGTQTVKLRFQAVAGNTPVSCGTPITGLGTSRQAAQLRDLRFFVSDVRLLRKDGSSVVLKQTGNTSYRVAGKEGSTTLVDLENGTGSCAEEGTAGTNPTVLGTVPRGEYTGARFTLGVPFPLNHTDSSGAPGPLGLAAMAWSWQFGRKFVKIELADPNAAATSGSGMDAGMKMQMAMPAPAATTPAPGTWAAPTYYVHVGSTGCTGNPATGAAVSCKAANRGSVRLAKFNPAKQQIAVDLQKLLAENDLTKSPDMMPGCMSGPEDPECRSEFKALGIGWQSGKPVSGQTVFRAIAR